MITHKPGVFSTPIKYPGVMFGIFKHNRISFNTYIELFRGAGLLKGGYPIIGKVRIRTLSEHVDSMKPHS